MLIAATRLPRSLTCLLLLSLALLAAAALFQGPLPPARAGAGPASRVIDILSPPYRRSTITMATDGIVAGDKLFFVGLSARSGAELWASDGTTAGTGMVKDIYPGPRGSAPLASNALVALGGSLLFIADDGSHGAELWVSDGTAAGTLMVRDIAPGPVDANPGALTIFRNTLYFVASDGLVGPALWRSDGTAAGTIMVADIDPSTYWYDGPTYLTVVGETLYFAASDGVHGKELWASDGTAAGTQMVKDLVPGAATSNPRTLTALGDRLFFSATDAAYKTELWVSDGTAAGTSSIAPVSAMSMIASGERVFFEGLTTVAGSELWVSDGTAAGTRMVLNLAPGSQSAPLDDLTVLDGVLYFINRYQPYGSLWRSDGTPEGTTMVAPAADSSFDIVGLRAALGRLFFSTGTLATGRELWTSDGTTAGTQLLQDLSPGPGSANPSQFTVFGGRLFFTASIDGSGLWSTNGAPGGAALLASIDSAGHLGSQPAPIVAVGPRVLFGATANGTRYDLFASDGTAPGTGVLTTTLVQNLVGAGGRGYFLADDGNYGADLWVSDGTTAGTRVVSTTGALSSFAPSLLALDDQVLYGGVDLATGVLDVRISDAAGTKLSPLASIPPPNPYYSPSGSPLGILAAAWAGDTIVLLIERGNAAELWRCPGDGAPAELLTRQQVGRELVSAGGNVFFSAIDEAGAELWASDGSVTGTARLADLHQGSGWSSPGGLVSAGDRIFFSATDVAHGQELWVSDGTAAGTHLVLDAAPGALHSLPGLPVIMGGTAYYAAWDAEHGRELWASDGTAAGTALVRDILPGREGSLPTGMAVVGDTLVFAASDGVSGYELWRSDGTAAGTALVQDIVPGPGNSNPAAPTVAGNLLFFTAEGPDDGHEPWAMLLESLSPPPTATPTLSPVPPTITPGLPTATPTLMLEPTPGLALNYALGRPGSAFLVTVSGYRPGEALTLTVNGVSLGSLVSDGAGGVTALLRTAPRSPVGVYTVSVEPRSARAAGSLASVTYNLEAGAPLREAPAAAADLEVMVPADLATMHLRVYLPAVRQE
jgi:ELWxxDGT repeat protein